MAFIYKQKKIVREIIHQRHRRRSRRTTRDDAGIVLNAAAKSNLLQHFNVIHRALADALRLEKLIVRLKPRLALLHLLFNLQNSAIHLIA